MIILRQRQYSRFGRFFESVDKRVKLRGNNISDSINKLPSVKTKERKTLLDQLYKEAKNSGIKVEKGPNYEFLPPGTINVEKGGRKDNPIFVAHELGHSQRYKTKFGKRNIDASLSDPASWEYTKEKFDTGKTPSFWKALKTSIKTTKQQIPQLYEEAAANRRGYRMLKDYGASPETLDLARKTYKLQHKEYRNRAKSDIISPFKNY